MSRDPVTIAELERDFEETYGSREQQFADWWANQEREADINRPIGIRYEAFVSDESNIEWRYVLECKDFSEAVSELKPTLQENERIISIKEMEK